MLETADLAPRERPYLTWVLGLVAGGLLLLAATACNTVSGAGADLAAAGGTLSETAEDVKE
jgi:predicted small secreted protein